MFENAECAIFDLSADLKTVDAKKKLNVNLESNNVENLLYDFLSEILFLKDSKYMVFRNAKASISENKKNGNYTLRAVLEGDSINPQKQHLENDIKAVTMHMFSVKKEKKGYKATVVVDI